MTIILLESRWCAKSHNGPLAAEFDWRLVEWNFDYYIIWFLVNRLGWCSFQIPEGTPGTCTRLTKPRDTRPVNIKGLCIADLIVFQSAVSALIEFYRGWQDVTNLHVGFKYMCQLAHVALQISYHVIDTHHFTLLNIYSSLPRHTQCKRLVRQYWPNDIIRNFPEFYLIIRIGPDNYLAHHE